MHKWMEGERGGHTDYSYSSVIQNLTEICVFACMILSFETNEKENNTNMVSFEI